MDTAMDARHTPLPMPCVTAVGQSRRPALTPETLEFVLVSFEGPDPYSLAGGLGVRVGEFSRAAAPVPFATAPAFVGHPDLPASEERDGVRVRRRCEAGT